MTCDDCPTGQFAAISGSEECELCPSGKITTGPGSTTCILPPLCGNRDCPSDLTGDGFVSTEDLLMLLATFGRVDCDLDVVGTDGIVNTVDLLQLLADFGRPC